MVSGRIHTSTVKFEYFSEKRACLIVFKPPYPWMAHFKAAGGNPPMHHLLTVVTHTRIGLG